MVMALVALSVAAYDFDCICFTKDALSIRKTTDYTVEGMKINIAVAFVPAWL